MIRSLDSLQNADHRNFAQPNSDMRTVVICETNPVLAASIQSLLKQNTILSEYKTIILGTHDMTVLAEIAPDILIIDPWQGAGPRRDMMKSLSGLTSHMSVVCYYSDITSGEAREIAQIGFRGVLSKTVQADEFVRVICAVAFGGVAVDVKALEVQSQSAPAANGAGSPSDFLSGRELDVLRFVAHGQSMKEIAETMQISTKTVDTYKARAFQKLKLRSRADVVKFAIDSGWMH